MNDQLRLMLGLLIPFIGPRYNEANPNEVIQ